MRLLTDKKKLWSILHEGGTVVTANNRLAVFLLNEFYKTTPETDIEKPSCLPISSFIRELFLNQSQNNESLDMPLLITTVQLRFLWQQILSQNSNIPMTQGLLQQAIDSWKKLCQWQIPVDHPDFQYNEQCLTFWQWWQSFEQKMAEMNAVSEENLLDYCRENFILPDNKPMVWACFDEFTPQQRCFQNYLSEQGIEQFCYEPEARETDCRQFAAADEETELNALMQWLKSCLENGQRRIAVVVPELQKQSSSLRRRFSHHFENKDYNFSLGQPLTEYPLVSHALKFLRLRLDIIEDSLARVLLYSPYIKSAHGEFYQRSQCLQDDLIFREKQQDFQSFLERMNAFAPDLASCLEGITPYPSSASASDWVNSFITRLSQLGFPGNVGLDSENYQCFQRLNDSLNQFRQLGVFGIKMDFNTAIHYLEDLLKQSIFQPQSEPAPIQISGMLEASGMEYDSLWIIGLGDQTLPEKPRLSAFIPKSLQISQQMPHSSAEKESRFAETLLQRFSRSANQVIFSFAKQKEDTPQLASPLIQHLPQIECPADNETLKLIPDIETFFDNYQIPYLADEPCSGGTALLANQAKCPFKAFANHRLKAAPASQSVDGLDMMERGVMIHGIMERIWKALGSQDQLLATEKQALSSLIDQAINEALAAHKDNKSYRFPPFIQTIEKQRLEKITQDCLEWEKKRTPFQVEVLEEAFSLNIKGMELKLRVDRIDRLENGKKWVIDYKSSLPEGRPWIEDRPKEPQLLLYALLDEQINLLMFIQLKTGHIVSKSFGEDSLEMEGHMSLKPNQRWHEFQQQWQSKLEELAEEALSGYCEPKPLSQSICQFCDYKNLCRYADINQGACL